MADAITANQIPLARLYVLRSGLKLEAATGMRLSGKVPKCSTIIKQEYGLKRNASFAECLATIEAAIKQVSEAAARGEIIRLM